MERKVGTQRKRLAINLDGRSTGASLRSARQEVVRWFFQVGGAAATIAKSMSAYDMTVSDAIYGPSDRYVSRQRLQSMLDHEYALLMERLDEKRGGETEFFAFADTVSARNYQGTNECHGWMGIRFQPRPRAEASQIVIHVRCSTRTCLAARTLGIIGVSCIHGFLRTIHPNSSFVRLDNLTVDRIEVDMVKFSA